MQSELKILKILSLVNIPLNVHACNTAPAHQTKAQAEDNLSLYSPTQTHTHTNTEHHCQKGWREATGTYWGVSVGSARAGMRAYLIGLCRATCGPHKLHNGHKHSNNEAADQDHKDASDVLHAQTWKSTRGNKQATVSASIYAPHTHCPGPGEA